VESAGHHHGAGVKWTNLHLRRVLQNPRLVAALRVHQGKVIGPGNWEPILDADTLHGITAFLNDPSRKNAVAFERRHLLSGIAKCGICGSALYGQPPYSSCAGGGPARPGRSP
jgi:site-specific DNA recombinase